jgi:hypothetical protein
MAGVKSLAWPAGAVYAAATFDSRPGHSPETLHGNAMIVPRDRMRLIWQG